MSDSVRISALSSSTTRTGSGSAAVANLIENTGDVIDREWFLEVRVDPIHPQSGCRFFGPARLSAVHDEGGLGTGLVHPRHRHAWRRRVHVHVEEYRNRVTHRHETRGVLQVLGDDGLEAAQAQDFGQRSE